MKRADHSLPNVVRFMNPEEDHVYATVFAIATYRARPTDNVVIITEERPGNAPEAIKQWFYPGEIVGAEFVYPKWGGALLASAAAQPNFRLPSSTSSEVSEETEPTVTSEPPAAHVEEEALAEAQPREEEVVIAQATPPRPAEPPQAQPTPPATGQQAETQPETSEELPATASHLPLVGILGLLAVFGGAVLRKFSHVV